MRQKFHMRLGAVLVLGLAVTAILAGAAGAGPGTKGTCAGGSVAPGPYDSLVVTGFCSVDSGAVNVKHDVTVKPGGGLVAAFGGSDLTVGGNLDVQRNGILVLGCEVEEYICFNDPDQSTGTMNSNDQIKGDVTSKDALAVLLHKDWVGGNVKLTGGGGGVNCNSQNALFGFPAYATVEDSTVLGSFGVSGWRTCWLGLIRNHVTKNMDYKNNVTADPDGNELVDNTIDGSLKCSGNSPAPQTGDSNGGLNHVGGKSPKPKDQCSALVAP